MFGIVAGHVETVEPNRLIADHTGASIGLDRVHPMCVHTAFGAGHKECARLMQLEESAEVQITPIHHVKSPRFDGQDIEHLDVAHLAIADVNEGRDRATVSTSQARKSLENCLPLVQVQQRVHLHRCPGSAKRRPIEQAQTQVDSRRVQRVDSRIEFQPGRLLGVKIASMQNQAHRQGVIDVPIALVQCVRERGSGRNTAQAHVKQLGLIGCQADLDVAQRLAPRQLRERHHAKQIGAVQGAHSRISVVSVDDASKGLPELPRESWKLL